MLGIASKRKHVKEKRIYIMPQFPSTGIVTRRQVSATFVDYSGNRFSVNIPISATANATQITNAINAIANQSNAALVKRVIHEIVETSVSNPAVVVYDETYSAVSTHVNMTFQDSVSLDVQTIRIPAPDASILASDRVTLSPTNPAINAVQTLLNAGGGQWSYVRGYLSGSKTKARRPVILPPEIVEPDEDSLPPDLPALPAP